MVVVRPSSLHDIPELQAIEIDAGELFRQVDLDVVADDDPVHASVLARHVRVGTAWTAELHAVVVGYALASVVDDEAHLDQVSVRREAGRRGIGRLLVDEVCQWAVAQGHEAVTLTTFAEVPWNGPYYERLGFSELPADRCGPELTAIRRREREAGIELSARIAMRLELEGWTSTDRP